MDARLLEILACPVCKGTLQFRREAQARSYTHCTIGLPASGNSAFPGRRVEA